MSQPKHVLTILAVGDLQRAARFYTQALGWQQTVNVPVYVEFEAQGGMRIGLYEREAFGRNTGRVPLRVPAGEHTPTELYFHVEELELAIQRMLSAGAQVLSEKSPREWGDEAAYFADPDGNVLVLARPIRTSASKG